MDANMLFIGYGLVLMAGLLFGIAVMMRVYSWRWGTDVPLGELCKILIRAVLKVLKRVFVQYPIGIIIMILSMFVLPFFRRTMYPLKPFKSDGCSLWPDGPWVQCCTIHDQVYHKGGTRAERKQADIDLMVCVAKKGYPAIGFLMYLGVRIGGVPWLPTPFRWGFGYPYRRGYVGYTRDE